MSLDRCPDHPEVLLEWDGYCFVCPECILDGYSEDEAEGENR